MIDPRTRVQLHAAQDRDLAHAMGIFDAPPIVVQRHGDAHTGLDDDQVRAVAARGVAGGGGALPHLAAIQRSFGAHDVTPVRAHVGGAAAEASRALGADAYATGGDVAFRESPSLFVAAHEAAHVVQQRAGVHMSGAVGQAGDVYEQHADAVAARVVAGESAADLLGDVTRGGGAAMQRKEAAAPDRAALLARCQWTVIGADPAHLGVGQTTQLVLQPPEGESLRGGGLEVLAQDVDQNGVIQIGKGEWAGEALRWTIAGRRPGRARGRFCVSFGGGAAKVTQTELTVTASGAAGGPLVEEARDHVEAAIDDLHDWADANGDNYDAALTEMQEVLKEAAEQQEAVAALFFDAFAIVGGAVFGTLAKSLVGGGEELEQEIVKEMIGATVDKLVDDGLDKAKDATIMDGASNASGSLHVWLRLDQTIWKGKKVLDHFLRRCSSRLVNGGELTVDPLTLVKGGVAALRHKLAGYPHVPSAEEWQKALWIKWLDKNDLKSFMWGPKFPIIDRLRQLGMLKDHLIGLGADKDEIREKYEHESAVEALTVRAQDAAAEARGDAE